jgi:hypothetical protein
MMFPHSSGRGVGRLSRMDFEISGKPLEQVGWIHFMNENLSNCRSYLILRGIIELLIFFRFCRYYNFGHYRSRMDKRLLKLLYLWSV